MEEAATKSAHARRTCLIEGRAGALEGGNAPASLGPATPAPLLVSAFPLTPLFAQGRGGRRARRVLMMRLPL